MKIVTMKITKVVLPLAVLFLFFNGVTQAAEVDASAEKFYGKITTIDSASKSLTVFNKKRQSEVQFAWDDQTSFTSNKVAIQPSALGVGQYLVVSYQDEGAIKKATSVAVRPLPGKKKTVN